MLANGLHKANGVHLDFTEEDNASMAAFWAKQPTERDRQQEFFEINARRDLEKTPLLTAKTPFRPCLPCVGHRPSRCHQHHTQPSTWTQFSFVLRQWPSSRSKQATGVV
eukprot:TRINITY_DN3199_c0_g1_i5.p2 TRINITY_DN3199_c0_g1~~TRINITY_DN3199_c0_g1_i5.p2  ORF type:complete len:109 (+),score=16.57 TRINITY_DN3199_c0_g1_i5:520-846(+)